MLKEREPKIARKEKERAHSDFPRELMLELNVLRMNKSSLCKKVRGKISWYKQHYLQKHKT